MDLWMWVLLVFVIAAIILFITGEVITAGILAILWTGLIWLLVTYAEAFMRQVWPAILLVTGGIVLSVVTLAILASTLEERRFRHDRGRPAPPR